jgi:hypothetical protein
METTTIQHICEEIRAVLENKKNNLVVEMRNYPTPVAGCDAQFNYLVEQRDKLFRDLSRLNTIVQSNEPQEEKIRLIHELLHASSINGEAILHLRQWMQV